MRRRTKKIIAISVISVILLIALIIACYNIHKDMKIKEAIKMKEVLKKEAVIKREETFKIEGASKREKAIKRDEEIRHKNIYCGYDEVDYVNIIDRDGVFTDSSGRSFDAYIDNENFVVFYSSLEVSSRKYAMVVSDGIKKNYDRILEFFDLKPNEMPKVKIFLYKRAIHFMDTAIKDGREIVNKNITGITMKQNLIYMTYELENSSAKVIETAVHEFIHCADMSAFNSVGSRWLFEGIAIYLSQVSDKFNQFTYISFIKNGLPSFEELNTMESGYEYLCGYTMVEYIYLNYGEEKLFELVENGGYDIEGILGISEEEYAEGWRTLIKDKMNLYGIKW